MELPEVDHGAIGTQEALPWQRLSQQIDEDAQFANRMVAPVPGGRQTCRRWHRYRPTSQPSSDRAPSSDLRGAGSGESTSGRVGTSSTSAAAATAGADGVTRMTAATWDWAAANSAASSPTDWSIMFSNRDFSQQWSAGASERTTASSDHQRVRATGPNLKRLLLEQHHQGVVGVMLYPPPLMPSRQVADQPGGNASVPPLGHAPTRPAGNHQARHALRLPHHRVHRSAPAVTAAMQPGQPALHQAAGAAHHRQPDGH